MKTIDVRFQEDPGEQNIDMLVRSRQRDDEVETLLERISGMRMDSLTVTDAEGAQVSLHPEEIILISMRGNVAQIETQTGNYTVRKTLQTIERALESFCFLRISRSELINMEKIEKIDFTVKRELRLELTGGIEVWVSRRYIPMIREQISRKEETVWSGRL